MIFDLPYKLSSDTKITIATTNQLIKFNDKFKFNDTKTITDVDAQIRALYNDLSQDTVTDINILRSTNNIDIPADDSIYFTDRYDNKITPDNPIQIPKETNPSVASALKIKLYIDNKQVLSPLPAMLVIATVPISNYFIRGLSDKNDMYELSLVQYNNKSTTTDSYIHVIIYTKNFAIDRNIYFVDTNPN